MPDLDPSRVQVCVSRFCILISKTQLDFYKYISFSFSNIQCNFLFSTIKGAGDGVFLKKDAPKNTIVAFFNGIHITLEDTLRYEDMKKSVHKMWNDWDR